MIPLNFKPEVLIAVPSFNLLEYVRKLIPTIVTHAPYILLLIDNGSTDGTTKYFDSLQDKKFVTSLLIEKNIGVSPAWNQALYLGFEVQKVKSVIILNNDTLLLPGTLDRLIYDLTLPGVALASARDVSDRSASEADFFALNNNGNAFYKETPCFSCFGVNKLCYDEIGLFDEEFAPAYFEDNDYHYRIKLAGLQATCNYSNFFFHYGSRSKKITPAFGAFLDEHYLKNEAYYLEKWGGKPGEETYTRPFNGVQRPTKGAGAGI